MKYKLKQKLIKIIEAKSKDENCARQEYILNILLVSTIFLVFIALIIASYNFLLSNSINRESNSLSLFFILLIIFFFSALYILSRKGLVRLASYIFVSLIFSLATYMACLWGTDLQASILFYVLVIVISGIIIGSKSAFFATFLVFLSFISINYIQKLKIISVNRTWTNETWGYSDIAMTSLILFIVATISWLFNRELKKSENNLKIERDSLEIKVEEKTKELKITQAKEIAEVYRFSEFGRLSSGLFHDLVNPLSTVMLNIDKIKQDCRNISEFNSIKLNLEQVIKASEKMREFINSVRKQIGPQGKKEVFCLNQEIEDAISVLNYKACKNQVCLLFCADEKINSLGDAIKFNQIVTNLASNAIDAYKNSLLKYKEVKINLSKKEDIVTLIISDQGSGITKDNLNKIFEPFFTTKIEENSLGLGLSLIKKIIEEDFLGKIKVSSQPNQGTVFTVSFPLK